jgi:polar amino acid transport system substrate-binding protein
MAVALVLTCSACWFGEPAAGTASSTGAAVVSAPASQLAKAGRLTVCTGTANPPQEFIDAATGNVVGADIELADEIARRMDLELAVEIVAVEASLPAVVDGRCDIVVSGLSVTAVRQQQVDMIPYFVAGQAFVVQAGNPQNVRSILDLCGKSVAVVEDSPEADHLNPSGQGAYRTEEGLSAQCKTAGKPAITSVNARTTADALAQLGSGAAAALFTAEAMAGYEVAQGAGEYEMVTSMTLERVEQGIGVAKVHPKLRDAVKASLKLMIADGTYNRILTAWGLSSDKVTAPLD